MKSILLSSLNNRLQEEISKKNPVYFLNDHKPLDMILDLAIAAVYMYTRTKKGSEKPILMTELVCAIGNSVRERLRLKRDSALAAKTGAFILYSFEEQGMLRVKLGAGTGKHKTYIIEVLKDETITALWESLPIDCVTKLPSTSPYAEWTSSKHSTGTMLVKTMNPGVLAALTPETHPIVFNSVNRAQRIGWNVNKKMFEVYVWALKNKTDAFADIWEMQNPEARASKVREAVTVGSIAKRLLNETFFHQYSLDFRGRRYCNSAFFHEQTTDLSKGLLLYAKKRRISKRGFLWLLISIASNWAGTSDRADKVKTDKLPLAERVYWALDHEDTILSYAIDPKENQGWMRAEKPWQFLAACMELLEVRKYQRSTGDLYGYESGLVVYVDGSNNGSQHLCALSKDEVTAPLVNLTPSTLPGDLYAHVANHVWLKIVHDTAALDTEKRNSLVVIIDDIIKMKAEIAETQRLKDLGKGDGRPPERERSKKGCTRTK